MAAGLQRSSESDQSQIQAVQEALAHSAPYQQSAPAGCAVGRQIAMMHCSLSSQAVPAGPQFSPTWPRLSRQVRDCWSHVRLPAQGAAMSGPHDSPSRRGTHWQRSFEAQVKPSPQGMSSLQGAPGAPPTMQRPSQQESPSEQRRVSLQRSARSASSTQTPRSALSGPSVAQRKRSAH
jgi:hypothetical protein